MKIMAASHDTHNVPNEAVCVVYVTAPSKEVAEHLAGGLVEHQLAACVNIVPGLTSVYRWEGKISKDEEVLLMIKTRHALLKRVTEWVQDAHPYDVPECISVPITGGSHAYMQWLLDSTVQR